MKARLHIARGGQPRQTSPQKDERMKKLEIGFGLKVDGTSSQEFCSFDPLRERYLWHKNKQGS